MVNELATYMCVNNKAIATNCRRWQFFDKSTSASFEKDFLISYLSIVDMLCSTISKPFTKSSNWYIDNLWTAVNGEEVLLNKCGSIAHLEKNEVWYTKCVTLLENEVRNMVNSCLVNTIDVLPNKGVIREENYEETIELDDYVKDLLGITMQTVIETPKEWYDLMWYLPEFIQNP